MSIAVCTVCACVLCVRVHSVCVCTMCTVCTVQGGLVLLLVGLALIVVQRNSGRKLAVELGGTLSPLSPHTLSYLGNSFPL